MLFSRALMCDLSLTSMVHLHIFLSSTMVVSLYGHMYLKCAMYEVLPCLKKRNHLQTEHQL